MNAFEVELLRLREFQDQVFLTLLQHDNGNWTDKMIVEDLIVLAMENGYERA